MDKIIKRNSTLIGLIGAILTISLYIYTWKTAEYSSLTNALLLIFLPVTLGIVAQIWARYVMKGSISFKQTVLAYFIVILFVFFAEAIINYLIFNILDPDAQEVANKAVESIREQNNSALAKEQVFKKPTYSAREYTFAFFTKVLMFIIPGFISGLIVSKAPSTKFTSQQ